VTGEEIFLFYSRALPCDVRKLLLNSFTPIVVGVDLAPAVKFFDASDRKTTTRRIIRHHHVNHSVTSPCLFFFYTFRFASTNSVREKPKNKTKRKRAKTWLEDYFSFHRLKM
jgi:hypothetical protein